MKTQILFIQGAGKNAHKEDAELVSSLRHLLGASYDVHYPKMEKEEDADYDEWTQQIDENINANADKLIMIGHSVGGSILIKHLYTHETYKNIRAIFLIAAPYWGNSGWTYEGYEKLMLPADGDQKLSKEIPLFLYHSHDDEVVPFTHLALYSKLFPEATVRKIKSGGHQMNNDLSVVADDIRELKRKAMP